MLGIGQAFELDRGMIAQARVDAFFVVEAIDVTGDGGVEFGIASEAASVGEFAIRTPSSSSLRRRWLPACAFHA